MQADILNGRPDDRQATGLRGEHINLISTLSHVAKQAFDGIRRLNRAMHGLRELIKREGLLFFLSQASHSLWIALAVLGFEAGQLSYRFLPGRLAPDAVEFGLYLASFSPGNGAQHIAPLMRLASEDSEWPPLTISSIWMAPRLRRSCEPPDPSLLAFLGTR